MNAVVLSELDHNRKRLDYYQRLKTQLAAAPSAGKRSSAMSPVDKWIEIYAERVRKLERQVTRLGLRTEIEAGPAAKGAAKKRA